MKLLTMVIMVLIMGAAVKRGPALIMQFSGGGAGILPGQPGQPGAAGSGSTSQFSSEESDLMSTVFQSAIRLFTGQASREQLAGELSDKLYAGRAEAGSMEELGIELVKPGQAGGAGVPGVGAGKAPSGGAAGSLPPGVAATNAPNTPNAPAGVKPPTAAVAANLPPGAKPPVKPPVARPDDPASKIPTAKDAEVVGGRLAVFWKRVKVYSVEMALVPVVFLGMVLVHKMRRRSGKEDAFMLPDLGNLLPSEAEDYTMKYPVHSLSAEDFEMLVALIYQRQGYRVSMPAGLSGGRGGDFTLLRKAERVLVQCKKLSQDHKVHVDRVRELHEAMSAAGATRAMYVASCGFSWDARNYGKSKGLTLINARTLDSLIDAAKETPKEDLLAVADWVPKFMTRVKLTPPTCPACDAAMDQVNASAHAVWVCSMRPDCRGRRSARKYQKPTPKPAAAAADDAAEKPADEVKA